MSDTTKPVASGDRDPHLLDRKAILEVYAGLINPSLADGFRRALTDELFDHVDAQGRLLAQSGNLVVKYAICPLCRRHDWPVDPTTGWRCGDPFHATRAALLDEIKRAMA